MSKVRKFYKFIYSRGYDMSRKKYSSNFAEYSCANMNFLSVENLTKSFGERISVLGM